MIDDDGGIQFWQQHQQWHEYEEQENAIHKGCSTEGEATACTVRAERIGENPLCAFAGKRDRREDSGH